VNVDLVSVETDDGVFLDGALHRPAANSPTQFGVDLVICHHGAGGNFYRRFSRQPSLFDAVSDDLLRDGFTVLRVNNRGHDTAFPMGRRTLGSAFEIVDDCRHDWKAWLDFAERGGYRHVALWGVSLGAVKTIYYLAQVQDQRVVCAIANSPPSFSYSMFLDSDAGANFREDLERATQLIQRGQGNTIIEVSVPPPPLPDLPRFWFSAQSYVDKYGPRDRYDYFRYLPQVRVPLLLTSGSLEDRSLAGLVFQALAIRGPLLHDEMPNVKYATIDGADHAYTNRTVELSETIRRWLKEQS
jgi:pimeloyl-ACP methyl ester carboxylesterase